MFGYTDIYWLVINIAVICLCQSLNLKKDKVLLSETKSVLFDLIN